MTLKASLVFVEWFRSIQKTSPSYLRRAPPVLIRCCFFYIKPLFIWVRRHIGSIGVDNLHFSLGNRKNRLAEPQLWMGK
uniref:Uncharacterized protein n=1 Tax=Picea glauca TaxID=3330 RepID=A0A117NG45_PICGL|nr:hypothetical protein ABT39_MTgene2009 [Picea glauca]QHR87370.1 hypothetical protein Q903MT_gene1380 [Picea sitchensis]